MSPLHLTKSSTLMPSHAAISCGWGYIAPSLPHLHGLGAHTTIAAICSRGFDNVRVFAEEIRKTGVD